MHENIAKIPDSLRDKINVTFEGDGNILQIGQHLTAGDVRIHLSGGAHVSIGEGCVLGHLFIHTVEGSSVSIGKDVGFNGAVRLLLHEKAAITIGSESLFGGGVDVTISDMHSIIDVETGARLNPARNIVIGERVWIGQNALILKGAKIGSGSVIGACSLVTGGIPENCVAAGSPARVIRERATWRKELVLR